MSNSEQWDWRNASQAEFDAHVAEWKAWHERREDDYMINPHSEAFKAESDKRFKDAWIKLYTTPIRWALELLILRYWIGPWLMYHLGLHWR